METAKSKKNLRGKIKRTLKAIGEKNRRAYSAKICRDAVSSDLFKSSKNVMIFASLKYEVNTRRIILECIRRRKRVILPKVAGRRIVPVEISDLKKDLAMGCYGIMEPVDCRRRFHAGKIDLIFVPGVVYDPRGYRIGYGGGYYDRFLRNIPRKKTAGLAFSAQILKTLPRGKHDVPVSRIFTEKGEIKCRIC